MSLDLIAWTFDVQVSIDSITISGKSALDFYDGLLYHLRKFFILSHKGDNTMAEDNECAICCSVLDDAEHCRINILGTNRRDGNKDVSIQQWSLNVCGSCYSNLADESAAVRIFRAGMRNE